MPLLLAVTGMVLVSVAAGWLLLDRGRPAQVDAGESHPATAMEPFGADPANNSSITDIDASLRMARLAADADILVFPPEQSALHFYGRVLAAEPGHAAANAELDAVLDLVSSTVADHLQAAEFQDAYELALHVAKVRPGHALVHDVQQRLDKSAAGYVSQAMQYAQDGKDKSAAASLAAAEALPGSQPDYIAAVRDSIFEIQESRTIGERIEIERANLAAAKATEHRVEKIRNAIKLGQLITPPGDSARDYLAEWTASDIRKEELTEALVDALIAESEINVGLGLLPLTETLLDAADELSGDHAELAELRDSLERAYLEAETNKLVSTTDLVSVSTVPPRYPERARARSISGWVEVKFTVTTSGETADIEVLRSEPRSIFNVAAIQAVKQWTFEPRIFRGQHINQQTAVRLVFDLD